MHIVMDDAVAHKAISVYSCPVCRKHWRKHWLVHLVIEGVVYESA